MQKELKALRGYDLFGKNVVDLYLVLNVKIPHKFKVLDFEKYIGNFCPHSHLVMYAHRMSAQTDNQQLLIHYFQDSLTGTALKWYIDLDNTKISTFRKPLSSNTNTTLMWLQKEINSEPCLKRTQKVSKNTLEDGMRLPLKSVHLLRRKRWRKSTRRL